ncbi:MAG: 4-hydroxy-tetrahydrodipicolinate reductase [Clostridiales bacterium]|nr:4-hydroxy-tetrahydrodipicolinate reductase [Candidatus Crickella merdequi]
MRLVITAPRGKMGNLITLIAAEREGIEIVGGLGPKGRDYIGKDIGEVAGIGKKVGAPVYDSIEDIIDECDCVIDFSTVEEAMHILDVCKAKGKALVCGSTGFSAEQKQAFVDAGADIPVMLAANTSRMVNVMSKLLAMAAKALGETCDIEIVDMHDAKKLDSPSGTAGEMRETIINAIGEEREAKYGRGPGRDPREEIEIGHHSLRGGDTPSSHIVYFMGNGERLEIAHHSINWKCFASGAVDAGQWIVNQPKGSYVISDCIEL